MRSSEKVRRAVLNQPGPSLILSIPSPGAPGLAWEMLLEPVVSIKEWEGEGVTGGKEHGDSLLHSVSLCSALLPALPRGLDGRAGEWLLLQLLILRSWKLARATGMHS